MQSATMIAPSSVLGASSATRGFPKTAAARPVLAARISRRQIFRVSALKSDKGSEKPFSVDPAYGPAFTREREHAVGRIACLGVAAAWFGEVVTGLGPITQLSYETGVSPKFAYGITLSLVAWQLFLGISPFSPTWNPKNQIDVDRRKKGITGITAFEPDVNRRIKPTEEPGKFFLRNELVLGRSAITSRNGPFLPNYFTVGKSYYPINFTLILPNYFGSKVRIYG